MRDRELWAEAQFGHANLGDARRTRRLVRLVAEAAARPAGVVSQACASSASREGAFRLLENSAVRPGALSDALRSRTTEQCRELDVVFVPVDGSSLTIADEGGQKGLGGVGAWNKGARGVQTMSALAIAPDGVPVGICGQKMWVRSGRSQCKPYEGPTARSESRFWLELLDEVTEAFASEGGARPWLQMDRGADMWPLLQLAVDRDALLTVRSVYDRQLETGAHLWTTLERARIVAKRRLDVPARPPARRKKRINGKRISYLTEPRRARVARVVIRAARVGLMCTTRGKKKLVVPINAVLVRETGRRDDRVEWMLLTTHPIARRRDVLAVVDGYTMRWRIEDFHRAWKRGLCRVEETQLRSRDAIFKWATILAAVATRALHLTHRAREKPDALASTEFSEDELQAIVALREPKNFDDAQLRDVTLGQAVRWIADIGGYTGPWNGPPGPTVIGRGLYDVLVTARAFANRSKKR